MYLLRMLLLTNTVDCTLLKEKKEVYQNKKPYQYWFHSDLIFLQFKVKFSIPQEVGKKFNIGETLLNIWVRIIINATHLQY